MRENNNEIIYEEAIKELAQKYSEAISSRNYVLGKHICSGIEHLRKLDILKIIKKSIAVHRVKKCIIEFNDINAEKCITVNNNFPKEIIQRKNGYTITFYTCIVGDYDIPHTPLIKYSNCNYILFSDKPVEAEGWNVVLISESERKNKTNVEMNRYIKFHPWMYFETDYAVYIDGNITIVSDTNDLISKIPTNTGIAMYNHPYRNCLYREIDACIYQKRGNTKRLKSQYTRYKDEDMPTNFGLREAMVIFFDLRNKCARDIAENWWDEFERSESGRDQIAFPYVVWKKGYTMDEVGNLGNNIREDGHFIISGHNA